MKTGLALILGVLCYALFDISRDAIWEALELEWIIRLGAVSCILSVLILFMIWGESDRLDTSNKKDMESYSKKEITANSEKEIDTD